MTTCSHESVYLDIDELRCRTGSESVSFPPHTPGLEDEKDLRRDSKVAGGEKRRVSKPLEVVVRIGEISCVACHLQQQPPDPDGAG